MTRLVLFLFVCAFSMTLGEDFREEYGYPNGYLADCPGITKPATIPRSQLKYIMFDTISKEKGRKTYTYHNAKEIAKDPRMDFKNKPTVLLVTGYLDTAKFLFSNIFSAAYQALGYNVINLEYNRFGTVHYFISSRLMRPVGKRVAEVLAQLTQEGLDPSRLELLGINIGAHLIGFTGKHYQELTGRNISRITGLDPAGPCFRTLDPEDRLAASDAEFVDVLHTNIDGIGMSQTMGQVDYFINGGENQPSDLNYLICTQICSHLMAVPFWQEALKHPKKFIAMKCDNIQQARDNKCYDRVPQETNLMGPKVDRTKHGIYYLATSKDFPYYLGKKGLKPEYEAWKRVTDINDGDDVLIYT